MSFEWYKYLDFAEYIRKNSSEAPDNEACHRAAVSRAYYAAFCTVREYLKKKNNSDDYNSQAAHKKVCDDMIATKQPIHIKIARQLIEIKGNRKKADYNNRLSPAPSTLSYQTIGIARRIIEEVSKLS